jgi:Ras-related protein Rab-6A
MTQLNPKVVFCGSAGVGKTTIFKRILEHEVDQTSSATMGAACASTHVLVNGQTIPLTLWDTAGQEEYRSLVNLYFRCTAVAVIVFDLSEPSTFEAVPQWHADLVAQSGDSDPDIILVGNKLDIRDRKVTEEQVETLLDDISCRYFEVSALDGTNIEALFRCVGTIAADRLNRPLNGNLNEPEGEAEKGGCC